MPDVSKIRLPDSTEVNIKDSRIAGVDTAPIKSSNNLVTSGGIYNALVVPSIATNSCEGFASTSSYSVHCLLRVKPNSWDRMYTFRFRVRAWVDSQPNVESVSDVTLQCYQTVVKSYYIQNGIADTSNLAYYNMYYYGTTEEGYNNGAESYLGMYVNSSNCWSYTTKRKFKIDLIYADECTVTLTNDLNSADARNGKASSYFLSSVKYNTYTAGLQETGDSNTTYSVISDSELQTGTATTSRTISAARLKANYSISGQTVNIAGNSVTVPSTSEVIYLGSVVETIT